MNQQQAVIKTFAKDTTRDEDPREALLKYADLAENDPLWVSNGKCIPAIQCPHDILKTFVL